MQRQWQGTGTRQVIPGEIDRIPEFDPRSGDHLWLIITSYRWGGPGVERPTLDRENLVSLAGPACYYCEQYWDERIARRRCAGKP